MLGVEVLIKLLSLSGNGVEDEPMHSLPDIPATLRISYHIIYSGIKNLRTRYRGQLLWNVRLYNLLSYKISLILAPKAGKYKLLLLQPSFHSSEKRCTVLKSDYFDFVEFSWLLNLGYLKQISGTDSSEFVRDRPLTLPPEGVSFFTRPSTVTTVTLKTARTRPQDVPRGASRRMQKGVVPATTTHDVSPPTNMRTM